MSKVVTEIVYDIDTMIDERTITWDDGSRIWMRTKVQPEDPMEFLAKIFDAETGENTELTGTSYDEAGNDLQMQVYAAINRFTDRFIKEE